MAWIISAPAPPATTPCSPRRWPTAAPFFCNFRAPGRNGCRWRWAAGKDAARTTRWSGGATRMWSWSWWSAGRAGCRSTAPRTASRRGSVSPAGRGPPAGSTPTRTRRWRSFSSPWPAPASPARSPAPACSTGAPATAPRSASCASSPRTSSARAAATVPPPPPSAPVWPRSFSSKSARSPPAPPASAAEAPRPRAPGKTSNGAAPSSTNTPPPGADSTRSPPQDGPRRGLDEIAAAAHLDPSSVCRLFRRFLGVSPHQYLRRRKMALAAAYLLERGGRVRDAAASVGMEDPFHFSRSFRAVHGVAPSALLGARR